MLKVQDLKEMLPFSYWSHLVQTLLPWGSEPERLGGHWLPENLCRHVHPSAPCTCASPAPCNLNLLSPSFSGGKRRVKQSSLTCSNLQGWEDLWVYQLIWSAQQKSNNGPTPSFRNAELFKKKSWFYSGKHSPTHDNRPRIFKDLWLHTNLNPKYKQWTFENIVYVIQCYTRPQTVVSWSLPTFLFSTDNHFHWLFGCISPYL